MKIRKRVISLFMTVCMIIMLSATSVFAEESNVVTESSNLNISQGTSLFEFDSSEEWQSSETALVTLDESNYVLGKASMKTKDLNPISIEGQNTSYYTIKSSGTIGDKLKDMKNMEFNIFVPDKSQVDYILINFYTDSSHNYFFQNAIGTWELSNGWNKIRRPLSDFKFINSIASTSSSSDSSDKINEESVEETEVLTENSDVEAVKEELDNKKEQLNAEISKENKSATLRSSMAVTQNVVPSSWDNIDSMEIFVAFKNGSKPIVSFDRIAYNVSGITKVMFTFDDAWYDVKQYAEPILSEKGFKGTLWANMTESVENNDATERGPLSVMSEAELDEMYSKGWDIGNHTVSHYDDVKLLTDDMMRSEYLVNQEWLLSKGWTRGAYHACYPSGTYNERLIEILQEIGVKTARCTEYGIQPTPVYNMYKLKTVFISRDTTIADIKTQIDKAVETGSSLFFMFHRVEDNPIYTNENEYNALAVSSENFRQIVEYVSQLEKQGKLDVNTISEWYNAYME